MALEACRLIKIERVANGAHLLPGAKSLEAAAAVAAAAVTTAAGGTPSAASRASHVAHHHHRHHHHHRLLLSFRDLVIHQVKPGLV